MLDFTHAIKDEDKSAIDAACFGIEERPVTFEGFDGETGYKGLFRKDTGKLLKVHQNSYTLLTNESVINAQYDAIKKANVSQDFDFNVHCLDEGRKLKVEVLFNDVTIEPEVGDYVKFRATAFNSYDGSWAFQNQTDGFRLWCLNGCTSADTIARVWARHTTHLNVTGEAERIAKGLDIFMNQKELWDEYRKTPINLDQAAHFFKTEVVPTKSKVEEGTFNKKQATRVIEQLGAECEALGRNKWALYNCLTHWASHTQESKLPEGVTRDREQAIAKAMRSKAWHAIAA